MKFEKLFRKNIILQKFILKNHQYPKNYLQKYNFYKKFILLKDFFIKNYFNNCQK